MVEQQVAPGWRVDRVVPFHLVLPQRSNRQERAQRLAELPAAVAIQTDLTQAFRALFLDGRADGMQPIQALGLFYDFRYDMDGQLKPDFVLNQDAYKGVKMIVAGECDSLPEQAFYMVGTIDEAIEKAKKIN